MPLPYIPEKFDSLLYTTNTTLARQSRSRRSRITNSSTIATEDAEYINEEQVLQFHLELEEEDTAAIELDGTLENSVETLTRSAPWNRCR